MTPTISTHVLDTGTGRPAAGVTVRLMRVLDDGAALEVGGGVTDGDGRAVLLAGPFEAGVYRVTFEVGRYRTGSFFREVSLVVSVDDASRSYHVPLLLAPFGVASYRGS